MVNNHDMSFGFKTFFTRTYRTFAWGVNDFKSSSQAVSVGHRSTHLIGHKRKVW